MCEAGPVGAARLVTIKITVSAVAAAMTTNASMIPCVTAAPCTTLFNTAAPRVVADNGIAGACGRGAVGLDSLDHLSIADLNVLSQVIGGNLSAHPDKGL